ncbi:MAG: hypothetical protein JHC71_15165 [Blastococcus sp.]|nr:hypothetical protein [Blastococcus sp.]
MRKLSWTTRRVVPVVLAVALAGSVLTWLAFRASGAESSDRSSLPDCGELVGTRLGALGEDPAWNGCLTDDGAAVQSYRYECSGLRKSTPPGGEDLLAAESAVLFLPDAGLVAATGQEWSGTARDSHPAYLRTPFALSVPYRCDEFRSLPDDSRVLASCDLDDVPLDLYSTQGCRHEGEVRVAVGRMCGYFEFDITVSWEQWSIEKPDLPGRDDDMVLESGPDEQWWAVPAAYRDQRCATPPDEWDPAW